MKGARSANAYSALCRQILDCSLRVRPRERVWINGWDHAVGLVFALEQESRKRGCEVVTTMQSEEAWLRSICAGSKEGLGRLSSFQETLLNEADVYVFTLGPRRPINWAKIPADRRSLVTVWFLEKNPFVNRWMRVAKRRGVKMLGIEATLATPERARARGLDCEAWRRAMFAGCLEDPLSMRRTAKRLSGSLGGRSAVSLSSPSGTNLTFSLDNRTVESMDGVAEEGRVTFLPAGYVGTTIDEKTAEGTIAYDSPISFPEGRVEGLTLGLERGRITEYRASSGTSHFGAHLRSLGKDSDRLGFFGMGLNSRLSLGYAQDDKVLGAVELNFGENLSRGGRNGGKGDWWGTVTRATLVIGGRAVLDTGRLLV